ncbi:MAG: hypothetical protein E6Q97_37075 [Desulfurellales bacterium]|nr:MAG: hypothetical protein E6Q97_37075 [Desulfurellales bacterium]
MIPESQKQRIENLERELARQIGRQRMELSAETNDGVIEVRLARTCDNGSYPAGNSRTYPLMFLDGPGGVYRDRSASCQIAVAYTLSEDCRVEPDTKVFAWRQNNEWWFLPAPCNTGDIVEHILVCKPDAAITDCCLYDARMIEHMKGSNEFCNETTRVTPVWARCANGYVDNLADGFCVLGKKLDDRATCTLDEVVEERDVYLIDCGNCPNCICPDPCDTLTARIQVLPDICGLGEITCQMQCVDNNPLTDDPPVETYQYYYGEFQVEGQEQRMLWGAGGQVYRETSPGVFEWVDESFWLEFTCQAASEDRQLLGVYYQNDPPGSDPVTEDYEIETGIEGCCPFLDSNGNPQYFPRTYRYALTCFCDTETNILDSLRIWWIADSWGQAAGAIANQTTACDDECENPQPTLADVPTSSGWWAAQSFEAVGECCANSKRFKTELVIDECHQDFSSDPEIRVPGVPDIIPDTEPPEENSNVCPGCVMGGSHIFAGCECGTLECDTADLGNNCDLTLGDCLTTFIVIDISWPLTWGAAP